MTKIYLVIGTNCDYIDYNIAHRSKLIADMRAEALNTNESNDFYYSVEEIELIE